MFSDGLGAEVVDPVVMLVSGFAMFAISSASATHSSRFELLAKHSCSHCKELEASSHN